MTSTSNASTTATFFFGRYFPGVENKSDVPLSTSFPSLVILASVRLEMTVTAITLEPTLFKEIFMLPLPRLT
jgi:hypothetical protein